MTKTKFFSILILFLLLTDKLFPQGLNNNYPIDSTDIQNIFSMMGVEMFKYPIKKPKDKNKKFIFNSIIEEYEDGKIISNINPYNQYIKSATNGNPITLHLPILEKSTEWFRIYSFQKSKNYLEITLNLNAETQSIGFKCDSSKYLLSGTRAMDFDGKLSTTNKTPLFVYYKAKKDTPLIHCPGNATPEEVVKMYGYVIIVYGKLEELKD